MPKLFDFARADGARRRALIKAQPGADFLLQEAVSELLARLNVVQRSFKTVVDIATPTGILASALDRIGRFESVLRLDRLAATADGDIPFAVADAEALPLGAETVDLAVSALALQTVNDLPGVLAQIRFALKPDGLFLATLLGGDTLTELRHSLAAAESELSGGVTPRVAPFAAVRDCGALLQRAGLALPVADQDRITVRYDHLIDLMRDLRAMGATNALVESRRLPLTRGVLERAQAVYVERYGEPDGRIRATFDLIWLSGWAPHQSQQQPLRPGSAKVKLAEALGTIERSAGQKPGSSSS